MRIGPIDPRCVGETNEPPALTPEQAAAHTWTPDAKTWETIKRHSVSRAAVIYITGIPRGHKNKGLSLGRVTIETSKDPVGAPIFYRDVALMPSEVEKGVIKPLAPTAVRLIAWRLRNVGEPDSRLLLDNMDNMPTCANCHSFSRDGKTLGMDLDGPKNDKGMYTLATIQPNLAIRNEDVIEWRSVKGKLTSQIRVGFMSQVSPDGQYVITTISPGEAGLERRSLQSSYYVANFKDYRFLQVFYPTRGILAWYSQSTGILQPLPGADHPKYVQTGAFWSPDQKYLVFGRAEAREAYPPGADLARYATDLKETQIQYDLYRIRFHDGAGGNAEPIAGASHNGMSNSFPKVSLDGRWIVFVGCRNGLLMRPDSKLYIIPAAGGEPRLMRANLPLMNSWHSFSPNGRWMVFSSKSRSPYTQMYLTHLAENGQDSPPILIENATAANRAVNIPEFVNVAPDGLRKIDVPAVDYYRVFDKAMQLADKHRYDSAIPEWRRAEELAPHDARVHNNLGVALAAIGNIDEAILHYRRAIQEDPSYLLPRVNIGDALKTAGKTAEVIVSYREALDIAPDFTEANQRFGRTLADIGRPDQAIAYLAKVVAMNPGSAEGHRDLGQVLVEAGKFHEAIPHLEQARSLTPDSSQINYPLGVALAATGRLDEAIARFESCLAAPAGTVDPGNIHLDIGVALLATGRSDEAIAHFEKAVSTAPRSANAHYGLGTALYSSRRDAAAALEHWRTAVAIEPNHVPALTRMAWVLATSPDDSVRNGAGALETARRAMALSRSDDPELLDAIAAAYADNGLFADSVRTARQALDAVIQQNRTQLAAALRARLTLYESGVTFREGRP
jgi:tetratricopeptide (TPR) repeat protein